MIRHHDIHLPDTNPSFGMLRKIWNGPERRRYRRYETSVECAVQVEMYGFDNESRPFFVTGTTLNMSRGGAYARVDTPLPAGAVCKVFFREADERVEPGSVAGRVTRCEPAADGQFRIAIAFDAPLHRLAPKSRTAGEEARSAEPATAG